MVNMQLYPVQYSVNIGSMQAQASVHDDITNDDDVIMHPSWCRAMQWLEFILHGEDVLPLKFCSCF